MIDIEVARYALRTFRITPSYGLGSVVAGGGNWQNGTCTARCTVYGDVLNLLPPPPPESMPKQFHAAFEKLSLLSAHNPPEKDCSCGIYGALSLEHLVHQYRRQCADIVAVIAAEGQTIIGPRGLRTQHARVVAYWTRYHDISRLAKNQFGAERFRRLHPMLKKYNIPRKLGVSSPIDPTDSLRYWA